VLVSASASPQHELLISSEASHTKPAAEGDDAYEIGRFPRPWVGDDDGDDDNSRASHEYLINILLYSPIPRSSSDDEAKESFSHLSESMKHKFYRTELTSGPFVKQFTNTWRLWAPGGNLCGSCYGPASDSVADAYPFETTI
jgi:hypothetical protein